ncbi:MAG TPA: D-aminoacylase [Planctomycetota bacterium]|nr:D-aminoacylase [Planctomycetota bacterium]
MSKPRRILFRGGVVIDGTGAPVRQADVLVEGGRIAAVGQVAPQPGDEVLDVSGLTVAPGFHDVHTHFDLSLLAEPNHLDGLRQGITTYHVGQCGLGFAPASPATQAVFRDYLAAIAGDPELPPFTTVSEYLSLLQRGRVNVVPILPHGLLRAEVAGMTRGPLTPPQLDRMKALAAEGMEQGARGISTGLTYFPGCEADTEELIAVGRVVAEHGGVYVSHLRNYTDGLLEAIDEACEIGRRAGLPVQISHLRPQNKFRGRAAEVLTHVERWRERGVDVAFDIYTYLKGYTLMSALFLPPEVYAGGVDAAVAMLRDPAKRSKLRAAVPQADWGEAHVASVWGERNKRFEGLRLPAFAAAVGKDVFDACIDLLIEERLRVGVVGWPIEDADHQAVLRHPLCLVGSDSIPMGGARHPRASGCFARYLGHYVREVGLLPLEEAIRRITSVPARRYGLADRGVIAEGMAADLVVFDPATITDRATYDQPRLLAEGVRHVLVNGELALRDGQLT